MTAVPNTPPIQSPSGFEDGPRSSFFSSWPYADVGILVSATLRRLVLVRHRADPRVTNDQNTNDCQVAIGCGAAICV